jgi:hypothetical protein
MLSDAEIATYREAFNEMLSDSCVIQRLVTASDGQGGSTSSWSAVGTALCTVSPLKTNGGAPVVGDQVIEAADRIVTLPAETDVRTADRLAIAAATYTVSELREPRTYEFVRRVEVRQA